MATDQQVQTYVNERMRPHAEAARALLLQLQDDKAVIDDIYQYLNGAGSGWVDNRTDGPPHLLTASDVLAYNSFLVDLIAALSTDGQWPVILKACVRAPL